MGKIERFGMCKLCGETLLPGEPRSPSLLDGEEVHLECMFREVAGGANHILRLCTCCGGSEPPDPPGMTRRDAARWALKVHGWVQELRDVMAAQERAKKNPPSGGS